MSSDHQSESRSETPSGAVPTGASMAAEVRLRGEPLLDALEQHQPGSRQRAEATGSYAFAVAVALGLSRDGAELCREAAKLSDIGRMYESEDPYLDGSRLALGAGVPTEVCDWIILTRERYDGEGPQRLAGAQIAIAARISRAAAACERALSQPELDQEDHRAQAVAKLRAAAGRELDPEIVAALVGVLEATRR